MHRNLTASLIILAGLLFLGCGGQMKMADHTVSNESAVYEKGKFGWDADDETAGSGKSAAESVDQLTGAVEKVAAADRKIIYTATLEVVVEQFDGVQGSISKLVKQHGGFVSAANLGRMTGERRSGRWTVRIPVKNYREFLNAVGDIGVPASRNESASDVTEEFVDITARIENKKKLEARILELLERPDDKIQHVIEVERELARVREAIERMEGRMRYLADATSLTTVDIHIREERDYVPPQALTLSSRVGNAWSSSLANAQRFFENAIVFIVGNAIGFGIFLLACLIAIPVLRAVWKRIVRWHDSPSSASSSTSSSTSS